MIDYRERWARYLVKGRNLASTTAFTYELGVQRLERFTGKARADISAKDVREFLLSDYHPATKNSTLVAIKSFHRWGAEIEELWPLNGIMTIEGPRMLRCEKLALTTLEARTLLDRCVRPNEFRAIWLGLLAGTRVSESAMVDETSWVSDGRQGWLRIVGKGSRPRQIPVHPRLQEKREMILASDATRDVLKFTCRSLAHVTGIAFSSHLLRHTFARTLRDGRVPRDVIGNLLGHAPTSTTLIYAPITEDEKIEASHCLNAYWRRPSRVRSRRSRHSGGKQIWQWLRSA